LKIKLLLGFAAVLVLAASWLCHIWLSSKHDISPEGVQRNAVGMTEKEVNDNLALPVIERSLLVDPWDRGKSHHIFEFREQFELVPLVPTDPEFESPNRKRAPAGLRWKSTAIPHGTALQSRA
jgi:hypothetical protein